MLSKHQRLFPGLFIVTFIVYIMFCLNLSSMSSRLNKNIQLDKKIEQSFFATSKYSTESPTILFQTTVFGKTPRYRNECPFECVYTSNRSFFNKADAVVFHANDLREKKRLKVANNKQKFVFFSLEAPIALERLSQGTWWKNVLKFHWIMSYAKNSHIQMNYKNGQLLGYFKDLGNKFNAIGDFTLKSVLKGKKKRGAIWFVSNCWSQERMQVAEALKKHFHVDIGGQCGDNTLCSLGQNCSQLISQYYFYLAFENANCVDYVTEKLFNKLDLPIVPIVMKRSVYEKILPPEAFIAVDDFDSAKTLANFLTFLINNPRLYFEYFGWRNDWKRVDRHEDGYLSGLCALCKKLHEERDIETKLIPDLKQWYTQNSKCEVAVKSKWFN